MKERLYMANFKNIILQKKENILKIQINRPDKHNALNALTLEELRTAVHDAL